MSPGPSRMRPRLPLVVTAMLVGLAVAAWLWPHQPRARADGTLLVMMPSDDVRRQSVLADLASVLGRAAALHLTLRAAATPAAFVDGLDEALVVIAPDGLAVGLPADDWQPLAAGRRRVPWNLRPASVLVSRTSAEPTRQPWRTAPDRTVFGDSLSLVCTAPLCRDGERVGVPDGVTWGLDPYDHRAVLLAARFGAFDHAVVRQWDAEAAISAGWIDARRWRVTRLTGSMPDVVALASRRLPTAARMDLQRALSVIGRQLDVRAERDDGLETGLGLLRLDGFNLLLGPDFERVRREFGGCWPRPVE